jgi:hypothetical protein
MTTLKANVRFAGYVATLSQFQRLVRVEYEVVLLILLLFSLALKPSAGYGLLVHEVS